jgi:nucleotide-binding universal stress UspA family protein
MNVMIAYDGSARSQAAIDDLARAGLGTDGVSAEIVRVAEVWIPPEDSYAGPSLWEIAIRDVATQGRNTLANARREAEAAADALARSRPEWKVSSKVESGAAALRLIERAERWPADLVVVGAQGHAVLERLGLGSVALKILTHLKCPVRVSRAKPGGPNEHLRIAVGVDGSPDAEAALEAVAARAWPAGALFRTITVVDHRVLAAPAGADLTSGTAASAVSEAIANHAADRLRRAGLTGTATVLHGDPKHLLVTEVRNWEADCLFVGARGLTRVQRFLLGSVSTSLAMHARCSVEVVHPR